MHSASRVLPDSDPFSIPTTSLYDRIAPVVRFLTMFVLFTIAGTTFLMSGGRNQPGEPGRPRPRPTAAATTTARQSLEPEASDPEPPIATPTAFGPRGVDGSSATEIQHSAPAAVQAAPTPLLASANGTPLPQVQITDRPAEVAAFDKLSPGDDPARSTEPPAIARLAPTILEVPSRQAQHDDNQPSLH